MLLLNNTIMDSNVALILIDKRNTCSVYQFVP